MSLFNIVAAGLGPMRSRLNRLFRSTINRRVMHKRIGVKLLNEINDTFKSETWEGRGWKALSPATLAMRRKGKGKGNPRILQDTGRLRGSFSPEHQDSRWKVTNTLTRVGTNVQYAPKHEFGIGLPIRRMIPSERRTLFIAIQVADGYIEEKIKQAGFL